MYLRLQEKEGDKIWFSVEMEQSDWASYKKDKNYMKNTRGVFIKRWDIILSEYGGVQQGRNFGKNGKFWYTTGAQCLDAIRLVQIADKNGEHYKLHINNLDNIDVNKAKAKTEARKRSINARLDEVVKDVPGYYKSIETGFKPKLDYQSNIYKKLRPIQIDSINSAIAYKEGIIGAGTASGKTILSIVLAKEILKKTGGKILIVTLKSIVSQWEEVCQKEGLTKDQYEIVHYEAFTTIIKFRKNKRGDTDLRSPFVNKKHKYKDLVKTAVAKQLKICIIDESQKLKNPKAQISVATFVFLRKIAHIEYIYGLSATPLHKSPIDIYGTLKSITRHPIGRMSVYDMEFALGESQINKRYLDMIEKSVWYATANTYKVNSIWDIKKIINSSFFRLKYFDKWNLTEKNYMNIPEHMQSKVLKELSRYNLKMPDVNEKVVEVIPDPSFFEEYKKLIEEAKTFQIDGRTINTVMMKMTVLFAKHKMQWVLQYLLDRANPHNKIVVMSSFTNNYIHPLKEMLINQGINVVSYTGDAKPEDNKKAKDDFINGDAYVILVSIKSGSVGLDGLQNASNTLLVASLVWSIGDFIQMVGRLRRESDEYDHINVVIPYINEGDGIVSTDRNMMRACRAGSDNSKYYLTDGDDLDPGITRLLAIETNRAKNDLKAQIAGI